MYSFKPSSPSQTDGNELGEKTFHSIEGAETTHIVGEGGKEQRE